MSGDIEIRFRGDNHLHIPVTELGELLFDEIEGIGDVWRALDSGAWWEIAANVETAPSVNNVLLAMHQLLSKNAEAAIKVTVEIAGRKRTLSELVQ